MSLFSRALIGTGFALQVVLRMRSEETACRLETLLATALARPRWAAGYVAVTVAGRWSSWPPPVAAALVVVGVAGFRRRDVPA